MKKEYIKPLIKTIAMDGKAGLICASGVGGSGSADVSGGSVTYEEEDAWGNAM